MKTDKLARMYDRLAPEERLGLIVAASARGDDAERERLLSSAPKVWLEVPDHYRQAEALEWLILSYTIRQLELAGQFWHASGHAENGYAREAVSERWSDFAKMNAYLFTVNADALQQLCAEMGVSPLDLLRITFGFEALQWHERAIRPMVFSAEDATAYLRREGDGTEQAVTVEEMVGAMRQALHDWASR